MSAFELSILVVGSHLLRSELLTCVGDSQVLSNVDHLEVVQQNACPGTVLHPQQEVFLGRWHNQDSQRHCFVDAYEAMQKHAAGSRQG